MTRTYSVKNTKEIPVKRLFFVKIWKDIKKLEFNLVHIRVKHRNTDYNWIHMIWILNLDKQ